MCKIKAVSGDRLTLGIKIQLTSSSQSSPRKQGLACNSNNLKIVGESQMLGIVSRVVALTWVRITINIGEILSAGLYHFQIHKIAKISHNKPKYSRVLSAAIQVKMHGEATSIKAGLAKIKIHTKMYKTQVLPDGVFSSLILTRMKSPNWKEINSVNFWSKRTSMMRLYVF